MVRKSKKGKTRTLPKTAPSANISERRSKKGRTVPKTARHYPTGLRRDPIDPRDYDLSHPRVQRRMQHTNALLIRALGMTPRQLPNFGQVNMRAMPPITNQSDAREYGGSYESCVGHSLAGILGYYSRNFNSTARDYSPMEIWRAGVARAFYRGPVETSLINNIDRNDPIDPRNALQELQRLGAMTRGEWNGNRSTGWRNATGRQVTEYYSLSNDLTTAISGHELLTRVKQHILSGIPILFGLFFSTDYLNIHLSNPDSEGLLPFTGDEADAAGHAMVICGYEDIGKDKDPDNKLGGGRLLIRNSWGSTWGNGGYGYITYKHITETRGKHTDLFWVVTTSEFNNIRNDFKSALVTTLRNELRNVYTANPEDSINTRSA